MKCCLLLCGLVVAFVAWVLSLPPPDLLCSAHTSCPGLLEILGPGQPSVNISLQSGVHLMRLTFSRRLAGTGFVHVQVAPSVTDEGDLMAVSSAKGLYPPGGFHLVYAEPNAEVLREWRLHLQALGIRASEASFVQSAVCAEDSEATTMYRPSQQLRYDFLPLLSGRELAEYASMNRSRVLSWLRLLSPEVKALDEERLASYLETDTVRCMTPMSFLKHAGVSPNSVDQLGIDLLGMDAMDIVSQFMALEGFLPHFLTFEYRGHHSYEPEVLQSQERFTRLLADRGYDVYRPMNDIYGLRRELRKM